jgi:AraC-like DNA-binding protein
VWIALGGRTSPAVHTMNSTHQFHRLENSFTRQRIGERAGDGALRRLIAREVIDRFTRLGGPPVVFVETTAPALRQGMAYPLAPLHPECGAVADRSRCRQSWPRHWETLRQSREPIWHRCVNQRFCATVPLCCDGQCLAVMRLVCRNAITELDFLKHVEMLNVLVQGFAATHQDELARLVHPPATSAGGNGSRLADGSTGPVQPHLHPQVARALAYIDEHLSDCGLTVRRVACEVGSNCDYLAHLFAEQVGERMSRFIARRRVHLAQRMLATTTWQVKRIAWESGFANANWFSHVFRVYARCTPSAYRHANRRP